MVVALVWFSGRKKGVRAGRRRDGRATTKCDGGGVKSHNICPVMKRDHCYSLPKSEI